MADTRSAREHEHDSFWAEVNLELAQLSHRPWDVLEKLEQMDRRLYTRLVTGEQWLLVRSDEYLTGDLPDLGPVRAGWGDWRRLFGRAVEVIENGGESGYQPEAKEPKG